MNFIVKLMLVLINLNAVRPDSSSATYNNLDVGRIIGGHESKPYGHPYLVSLQTRILWMRFHVCGGSILNEEWVLTAAHCIKDSWLIRWLPLDAIAGTHEVDYFGPRAQIRAVEQRIEHPLYEGGIGPHDIAVLRLETPFTFTNEVQPVYLPHNYNMSNDSLILAGWGALKTTILIPDRPSTLQEVKVTYIPYDDCRKAIDEIKDMNEYNPLDKDANICTGPITGGVAACSGDSGGPLIQLVTKNKNEHLTTGFKTNDDSLDQINDVTEQLTESEKIPIVYGIVSWGLSPCGDKGAPTVYTKTSQYIDFINAYVNLRKHKHN